jgi:hypothetical protein
MRIPHGLRAAAAGNPGYVAFAYSDGQAGTSYSVTVPSAARQGDFLLFFCTCGGTTAGTFTATGITTILNLNSTFSGYISNWNGATTSYTITTATSGANVGGVGVLVYRRFAYDTASALTVNTQTPTAASITLTSNNSILVFFARTIVSSSTWSNLPAGFSTIVNDSSASLPNYYVADKANMASGSTGTTSVTSSVTSARAWQVGLKPA